MNKQIQAAEQFLQCFNCAARILSYPCAECGAEPFREHECNGCWYSSKSGITLSHDNAKQIGINCNKRPAEHPDQPQVLEDKDLREKLRAAISRYNIPLELNTYAFADEILALVLPQRQAWEREAEDQALLYAHRFVDIFKDKPDQVGYILKNLDGEHYRKHKATKVELRFTDEQLTSAKEKQ
jgi:hypothetical protein